MLVPFKPSKQGLLGRNSISYECVCLRLALYDTNDKNRRNPITCKLKLALKSISSCQNNGKGCVFTFYEMKMCVVIVFISCLTDSKEAYGS